VSARHFVAVVTSTHVGQGNITIGLSDGWYQLNYSQKVSPDLESTEFKLSSLVQDGRIYPGMKINLIN